MGVRGSGKYVPSSGKWATSCRKWASAKVALSLLCGGFERGERKPRVSGVSWGFLAAENMPQVLGSGPKVAENGRARRSPYRQFIESLRRPIYLDQQAVKASASECCLGGSEQNAMASGVNLGVPGSGNYAPSSGKWARSC